MPAEPVFEGPPRIDLRSREALDDPYAAYEALRMHGPVLHLRRHGPWIVLGLEDMKSIFARPALFSNEPYDNIDAVLIGADPPRHFDVRRLIALDQIADRSTICTTLMAEGQELVSRRRCAA